MSLEGALRVKLMQEFKALLPMLIRDIVREELDKREAAKGRAVTVDREAAPEVTVVPPEPVKRTPPRKEGSG